MNGAWAEWLSSTSVETQHTSDDGVELGVPESSSVGYVAYGDDLLLGREAYYDNEVDENNVNRLDNDQGFGLDFEAVEWGGGTHDTVSEEETLQDHVQGEADAGPEVNSIFGDENVEDTNRIQVEDEHDMISGVDAMIGALRK